jgi:phage shock protein C
MTPDRPRFALDKRNAILAGVCSGLARRYGWDIGLVRIATVLGTIFAWGGLALIYILIAWLARPSTYA